MPTRLSISEADLLPIQAFFNAIGDSSFLRVIDCLTKEIGYSINDADCSFPSDLDPGEEPFDGVRFSLFEEQIVIPKSQLRKYLEIVCGAYVAEHPEDEPALKEHLGRTAGWQ